MVDVVSSLHSSLAQARFASERVLLCATRQRKAMAAESKHAQLEGRFALNNMLVCRLGFCERGFQPTSFLATYLNKELHRRFPSLDTSDSVRVNYPSQFSPHLERWRCRHSPYMEGPSVSLPACQKLSSLDPTKSLVPTVRGRVSSCFAIGLSAQPSLTCVHWAEAHFVYRTVSALIAATARTTSRMQTSHGFKYVDSVESIDAAFAACAEVAKALRKELHDLPSRLDAVHREMRNLRSRRNAVVPAISRLPSETLAEIFLAFEQQYFADSFVEENRP